MPSTPISDADGLPGENRSEIDFFLAETDATAMRNHNGSVVERIVDVGQTIGAPSHGR